MIEFSVTNFRSIGEQQSLRMNAGRFTSERVGAVLDTCSKHLPNVLRAMALMGANGAGKSSIILGLQFLHRFVSESAQSTQIGDKIGVVPFKLDESFSDKPSEFEILFVYEEVEYQYDFSVNSNYIVSEQLLARSKGKAMKPIFSRERVRDDYIWSGKSLPKSKMKLWTESTRDNALFLSTAVQLNSKELSKPFEWISKKLRVQTSGSNFFPDLTSHLIKDHVEDGCRDKVINLIREADLGIRDIVVTEEDFDEDSLPEDMPDDIREKIIDQFKDETFYDTKFTHRTKQLKNVNFDYEDESDGTQRLYAMAGPIISSLEHDYVLVIDEIEMSLHPYIVRMLVNMFQNPDNAETHAQIIFTTHDDGFLDSGILERDQFVFVEKRRGQTQLIPLNDYRPRKGEALRSNYLRGRYGGVPSIPKQVVGMHQ